MIAKNILNQDVSKEFIDKVSEGVLMHNQVVFHLKDGTNLLIPYEDINNASYNSATNSGSDFEVGAAVIGQLALSIWDLEEDLEEKPERELYRTYDFVGTTLTSYVGVELDSGEIEWVQKGVFNVSTPKDEDEILSFTCLDNMSKFDKTIENIKLYYPATFTEFVRAACEDCGVVWSEDSKHLKGYAHKMTKDMLSSSSTYRDILSKIAEIEGFYVRCNNLGELVFDWYNIKNEDEGTPDVELEIIGNKDVDLKDIEITGIRAFYTHKNADGSEEQVIAYYPEENYEGFIYNLDNQFLTEENVFDILEEVGTALIGTRIRPMSFDAINNPLIEPGDTAHVIDGKGRKFFCYLSNITFNTQEDSTYSCDCESEEENNAQQYDQRAKTRDDMNKIYAGMEDIISLADMPVYTIENPTIEYKISKEETEIINITYAAITDCTVVFAATIEINMESDGIVIFRNYFNGVQDKSFELREYLDKGHHIITITRPIQCQNEERYIFSTTAQTEMFIEPNDKTDLSTVLSKKRINDAYLELLMNFAGAMQNCYDTIYNSGAAKMIPLEYAQPNIDTRYPEGTIKANGIHGYIFGQGLAATGQWDGTILCYENIAPLTAGKRTVSPVKEIITTALCENNNTFNMAVPTIIITRRRIAGINDETTEEI